MLHQTQKMVQGGLRTVLVWRNRGVTSFLDIFASLILQVSVSYCMNLRKDAFYLAGSRR